MMNLKHLTLAVGLALGILAPAHAADKKPNLFVIWGDSVQQGPLVADLEP